MVVPASPGAPFEVIQPEFALEFLVVLFDLPACVGQRDELFERPGARRLHEVVLAIVGAGDRPLADEPAVLVALRRAHAHSREAGDQGPFGPGAPTDAAPRPGREARR